MIACAAVLWQSSHAAFSDTTSSSGNRLGAGTVDLSVNRAGAATMFSDTALAPGDPSHSECIGVRYTGSLTPTSMALYFPTSAMRATESESGGAFTQWVSGPGPAMDDNVTIRVESTADLVSDPLTTCVGTYADVIPAGTNLRTLLTTKDAWGTGSSYALTPMGPNTYRSFRFTYTFPASAANNAQGDGVEFTAMWEAQR